MKPTGPTLVQSERGRRMRAEGYAYDDDRTWPGDFPSHAVAGVIVVPDDLPEVYEANAPRIFL